MSAPDQFSQKLLQCLIKLETGERSEAKIELAMMTNELMPKGKPDLLKVRQYPMISKLAEEMGRRKMMAILVLIVKDFCSSLNVVRNMNEDQMIEAAAMLLEECDNFRIEDYVIMFSMVKRGQLVKIYDRIDLQFISQIMDEYWLVRHRAGVAKQDEEYNAVESLDKLNPSERVNRAWVEGKGYEEVQSIDKSLSRFADAINRLKNGLKDA